MNRTKALAIIAIANCGMAACSFAQNQMVQANILSDSIVSGAKLTFHRYGGQYFQSQSFRVPLSKKERATQLLEARVTPSNATLVAAPVSG
jgi:hypothetical protein